MGRELLKRIYIIPNPVTKKWSGVLVHMYRLRWSTVLDKRRVKKEAWLL
jgi:hypothetical protein